MPESVLPLNITTAICPHGGQVSTSTSNQRVFVVGQPVLTQADTLTITGCSFNVGGKPQPCSMLKWQVPATRILINGQYAILQNSGGLCQSAEQIPQGPPNVCQTQVRVKGI
jgi:hypothetical protein